MWTRNKNLWVAVLGLAASVMIVLSGVTLTAQTDKEQSDKDKADKNKTEAKAEPPRTARQRLMDGKMVNSQEILRSLIVRDFESLEKCGVALNVLTLAEEWAFNNSKEYLRMSEDMRRISKQLAKAAHNKDLNAATIAYQRLTLNCLECHQALKDGFK